LRRYVPETRGGQNNPVEGNHVPLFETMPSGTCLNLPASLRRKSGQSVGVHLRTVPQRAEDGRLQGAAELSERSSPARLSSGVHDKLAAREMPG